MKLCNDTLFIVNQCQCLVIRGFKGKNIFKASYSSCIIAILRCNVNRTFSVFLYSVCNTTCGKMLQINEGFYILKGLILFISVFIRFYSSTLSAHCCLYDILKFIPNRDFKELKTESQTPQSILFL